MRTEFNYLISFRNPVSRRKDGWTLFSSFCAFWLCSHIYFQFSPQCGSTLIVGNKLLLHKLYIYVYIYIYYIIYMLYNIIYIIYNIYNIYNINIYIYVLLLYIIYIIYILNIYIWNIMFIYIYILYNLQNFLYTYINLRQKFNRYWIYKIN